MADQICGIHLGNDTLSALTLRRTKKGWSAGTGMVHNLPPGERAVNAERPGASELVGSIKSIARAVHFSRGEVYASLPKQQAIVRNIMLPSTDPAELAQMARFEAERHIPIHPERHCTGYHIMRSMGVEGSEVLLGAVDGPIVERALDSTLAAGLTPRGITLSSAALINSLTFSRREWMAGKTIAILSIGLDALDLVLATDGRVVMARSVQIDLRSVLESWMGFHPSGDNAPRPDMIKLAMAARMIDCQQLEPAPAQPGAPPSHDVGRLVHGWLERIVQELRRTYDFARRESKCPPIEALVLTGEGASLRNIDQYLLTHLDAELIVLNPIEALNDGKGARFPFGGLEFAIPFGAAIANELPGAYRLDLTPTEHYRRLARKRTVRGLIFSSLLLLLTLGLAVASYIRMNNLRQTEMAAIERVLNAAAPKVNDLNEMKTKLAIIKAFLNDPNSALAVLDAVVRFDQAPGRVTLYSIDYEKGEMTTIEGNARDILDLSKYQTYLRATGKFDDVRPIQQNVGTEWGQKMYTFKLECPLSKTETPRTGKGGK